MIFVLPFPATAATAAAAISATAAAATFASAATAAAAITPAAAPSATARTEATATTARSATRTLFARPGFVNVNCTGSDVGTVQSRDRFVAFFGVDHFHKREAAGTSGFGSGGRQVECPALRRLRPIIS